MQGLNLDSVERCEVIIFESILTPFVVSFIFYNKHWLVPKIKLPNKVKLVGIPETHCCSRKCTTKRIVIICFQLFLNVEATAWKPIDVDTKTFVIRYLGQKTWVSDQVFVGPNFKET